MKATLKLLMVALLAGWFNVSFAQNKPDYMNPPKQGEQVIDNIVSTYSKRCSDASDQEVYMQLVVDAQAKYPTYVVDIRSVTYTRVKYIDEGQCYYREYKCMGKVIKLGNNSENQTSDNLSKALDKALQNIKEGNRIAIDQVRVINGINKDDYKDQIVEILLDNGYKVVAKEYLERLYDELQGQQSGVYNDKTTVQDNNFSAVGYYLNVKLTETSLRVQVINVSTGEYEGNVTIKL